MAVLSQTASPEEILDQFKEARLRTRSNREAVEQEQRNMLRESTVQLREPSPRAASSPASTTQPSFKLGDAKGFPYVVDRSETTPGNGHLSPKAAEEFFNHLKDAATKPDVVSREAAVGRAANVASQDLAHKQGLHPHHSRDGLLSTVLHEARTQAVFASHELGQRIGVGPVESSIIGYSLERALEKEGIKVFANHAIDKSADIFQASAAAVANATGMRHSAESTLSKSMNWLSSHGVTKDGLKDALGKHMGKLIVLNELSNNPEVVQKAALTLANSDKLLDGAILLAKDDEFRKSVGTMTLATGEAVAGIHKGAGSIAILAGSALRGDSTEETARHAFRAALTVLGGAAGGLAGAGFASVATGTVGAMAGSAVADKLLELYDKHLGSGTTQTAARTVSQEDMANSSKVIASRVAGRMQEEAGPSVQALAGKVPSDLAERAQGLEREYSMHKPMHSAKG